MARLRLAAAVLVLLGTAPRAWADATLTVAAVGTADMATLQRLSPAFEKAHPDIHLRWVVLDEAALRARMAQDAPGHAGDLDVVTVGAYEVPIWARQGWLLPFDDLPASYDEGDLLRTVRDGDSQDGKLYALPFRAESAVTYYRTDLFKRAGLSMPDAPTWEQVRQFADRLTDRAAGTYGLCLRGRPAWDENMAVVTSLVTAMGGQWFDASWRPVLDTRPWHDALSYYDAALKADGPPGAASNGYGATLALFAAGHCALWVDATGAAGQLYDPRRSKVAAQVGVAPMPTGSYTGGPTWLWSWNLAVPAATRQAAAARTFAQWATSREYVQLVARQDGWVAVPPGTRAATYAADEYRHAAPFAAAVLKAIQTSNPDGPTREKRPYAGAQFADIPPFPAIGTQVGQAIAATLAGATSPDAALKSAQAATTRAMTEAGYLK